MENPIAVVKSNLTVSKLVGFAVLAVAVFAVFDFAGLTNWILFPVTTAKAKFARTQAAP
jgi:hypothetical protein